MLKIRTCCCRYFTWYCVSTDLRHSKINTVWFYFKVWHDSLMIVVNFGENTWSVVSSWTQFQFHGVVKKSMDVILWWKVRIQWKIHVCRAVLKLLQVWQPKSAFTKVLETPLFQFGKFIFLNCRNIQRGTFLKGTSQCKEGKDKDAD